MHIRLKMHFISKLACDFDCEEASSHKLKLTGKTCVKLLLPIFTTESDEIIEVMSPHMT